MKDSEKEQKESNVEKDKGYLMQKEVLSFDEACIYLDGISSSYLYKLTSARRIPHYCPTGKLIFFRRSELEDWVFKKRRKTVDELHEENRNFLKGKIKR